MRGSEENESVLRVGDHFQAFYHHLAQQWWTLEPSPVAVGRERREYIQDIKVTERGVQATLDDWAKETAETGNPAQTERVNSVWVILSVRWLREIQADMSSKELVVWSSGKSSGLKKRVLATVSMEALGLDEFF